MIRYLTAGESHGPALSGIIEGMPANVPISIAEVNHQLKRRMQGYGRGGRMKIETDEVEILSGIRFNKTLGSPIGFVVKNRDFENWAEIMAIEGEANNQKSISKPRPGHADLSGAFKYNFEDMRNVLERSSARETAMRVAAGSFSRQFLKQFNVHFFSHILQIGKIKVDQRKIKDALTGDLIELTQIADSSPVRVLDSATEPQMIEHINQIKRSGDTVGGIIELIIRNVPPGLGSYVQWDRKLDSQLAGALISIQAVKGVEFGAGFAGAVLSGSNYHDEIEIKKNNIIRSRNNAGGVEGGMSNGEDIVIRIVKKPIPTLMKPLRSVDIKTKESFIAHKERGDITAVPACSVIAEAVCAPVIANAFLEKFGGDSLADIKTALNGYLNRIKIQ
jgi:chorismate synthase